MRMRPVRLALLLTAQVSWVQPAVGQRMPEVAQRVVIDNDGWELVGDLRLPPSSERVPAVLMLNQAGGSREAYVELARLLAEKGVASLRLDLRGHGESTNMGRFVPGEVPRDPLIWGAEADVIAAHEYLRGHPRLDGSRLGFVGASYSGEEMAEAGRLHGFAAAYVLLSPGSLGDQSVRAMDTSGVPWLLLATREDPFLSEISSAVQAVAASVEVSILPGTGHGTDMLVDRGGLAERVALWLAHQLSGRG